MAEGEGIVPREPTVGFGVRRPGAALFRVARHAAISETFLIPTRRARSRQRKRRELAALQNALRMSACNLESFLFIHARASGPLREV